MTNNIFTQKKEVLDLIQNIMENSDTAEILEEKYKLYHKDFSSAMKHAYDTVKKMGYEVDPESINDKVAFGPRKPSSGKTNSYRLDLLKKGKPQKKGVQIQVYNMDNKSYELNMYLEEVELAEATGGLKMLGAADELEKYAKKYGGIDKKDFLKVAKQMRKGMSDKVVKMTNDLDTEPREKIVDVVANHIGVKSTEKMFGVKFLHRGANAPYKKESVELDEAKWEYKGNTNYKVGGNLRYDDKLDYKLSKADADILNKYMKQAKNDAARSKVWNMFWDSKETGDKAKGPEKAIAFAKKAIKEEVELDENKKAELAKKLAKSSQSSKKGKDKVTLKKAPWDKKEEVQEAPLEEGKMSPDQIEKLKKGYESLRGKKISAQMGMKISRELEKLDKSAAMEIAKADIPFVSTLAINKLMMNFNMSGSAIRKLIGESVEELVELTKAEKDLISKMYDKKGNLTPLGQKVMDHGKKEELSPKQKKIDANNNGKVDGEDLAKLRSKKEEVLSQIKNLILDEGRKKEEVELQEYSALPTVETLKKMHDEGKTKKQIMAAYSGCDSVKLEKLYAQHCTEELEEKFSPKEIKMAIGVASDKRYAGGNMTGAVKAIDKIKKGLSNHPQVSAVLKRQNEEKTVCPQCEGAGCDHCDNKGYHEELSPKQKKIDKNKNGKIDGSDLASLRKKNEDFDVESLIESSDKKDAKEMADLVKELEPKIKMTELKKQVYDMAMEKYNNKTRAKKIASMIK